MAVKHHQAVAIFSLEMSAVQLVNRLIASETELSAEKLKTGRLTDEEWQQLHSRIKALVEAPILVDDTPALSIFELRAKCRRLKQKYGIKSIDYRLSAVDDRRCRYAGKPGTGSEFDFKAAENYCQGIEYSCYGFVPVEPWGRIPGRIKTDVVRSA